MTAFEEVMLPVQPFVLEAVAVLQVPNSVARTSLSFDVMTGIGEHQYRFRFSWLPSKQEYILHIVRDDDTTLADFRLTRSTRKVIRGFSAYPDLPDAVVAVHEAGSPRDLTPATLGVYHIPILQIGKFRGAL